MEVWQHLAISGAISLAIAIYLRHLTQVDQRQEKKFEEVMKSIDLLFRKHDEDSKRLDEFELDIARHHYQKTELDSRFDKLEATFKDGFKSLGDKFETLSAALLNGERK